MQKNKLFTLITLTLILIISGINGSPLQAASQPIKIYMDGQLLSTPSSPIIENGVTLIPMRSIFEAFGAEVAWSKETQTIIAKKDATSITLVVGKKIAFINTTQKSLLYPPKLKAGTTYVPLRFISESLNAEVGWNAETRTVFIQPSGNKQTNGQTAASIQTPLTQNTPIPSKKELTIQEIGKKTNTIALIENFAQDGSKSFGSGFVISEDGKIVTNYHVVANAKKLIVSFENKKEYSDVSVVGYDILKDIAVLKLNTTDQFSFNTLGDSSKVVLGDSIVVIGNPMGLRNTLSTGIISSLSQKDYIQITAPISPGSSGGALFNTHGEVIGIASAGILEGENLGFCIPINEMKKLSLNKTLSLAELAKIDNPVKPPQNIEAFPLSSTEVAIQWDYDDQVDYYHVYHSDSPNGKFVPYVSKNNKKEIFTWEEDYSVSIYDLSPLSTTYFKVTAVRNGVESPFSQTVSVSTPKEDTESYINIVKESSFYLFPKQKIGDTFNRFFTGVKWTYFRSKDNEDTVEFTGTCTYQGKDINVLLQFVVYPSSHSFETVYMERNGISMPYTELDDLLKAIFNK